MIQRGRIVVEIHPELKKALKAKLALQGISLRAWIERQARIEISKRSSPNGESK